MSSLATLALKRSLSAALHPTVPVPGLGDVPLRFASKRFDPGVNTYCRVGTCIENRSVTGSAVLAQIDVFTRDPDGADAYRTGDVITKLLTEQGLDDHSGFAFPWIRAGQSFDQTEEGANGEDVLHLILQFDVGCQDLVRAPGRF